MRRSIRIGKAFDLKVVVDGNPPTDDGHRGVSRSAKRVAVGQEFDAKITSPKDWVEVTDAVTRTRMAWAVLAVIATFLFGATALGLYKADFSALQNVWSIAGPIYGGIAGYFYHRHKK